MVHGIHKALFSLGGAGPADERLELSVSTCGGGSGADCRILGQGELEEMAANVDDVAALLLARLGPMDTWRLQKLLYYSQAWHLAYYDEPVSCLRSSAYR